MAQALAIGAIGAGGILGAGSVYTSGQQASRMATMNAGQLEEQARGLDQSAIEQQGVSQIRAKETKRQATLLQSRLIALAAAGGGSTQEKSINDNLLNIEGEGEYRALMDLYNGDSAAYELRNKALGLRKQAVATRFEGKAARKAGTMAAFGSILNSAGSAASFSSKFNPASSASSSSPNYLQSGMPNYTLTSKF